MQGASQRKPCQSGERIALWGQVYCLRIVESAHGNGVEQKGDEIVLTVKPDGGHALAQKVLDGWLRSRLEEKIAQVRGTLESKTGVLVSEWRIRDMKTKWAAAIYKKRICLNLKLAQMPERCLIYVMIHELTHLLEAGHNQTFYGYMDRFCPGWQDTKRELAKRAEAFL
jgi:predicted metal-dependent hydrolase